MSIDIIKPNFAPIPGISPKIQSTQGGPDGTQAPASFGDMLKGAIKEVDSLQKNADQQIDGLALGKGVTAHEAMIALEKADMAFQLMNQIRTKIIRAYEEVMRTQV